MNPSNKKARVTILVSDKVEFRIRNIRRKKKRPFNNGKSVNHGNSLRPNAVTTKIWIQSLVGKLRSCKLLDQKKKKSTHQENNLKCV